MTLALAVPIVVQPFIHGDVAGIVLVTAATVVSVSYLNRLAHRWYAHRAKR